MNPNRPETWQRLEDHPTLKGGAFDSAWYDGDAAADLGRLRKLAAAVLAEFPECRIELHVLDDLTMYVTIDWPERGVLEVTPCTDASGHDSYYVELPNDSDEHYPPDVAAAVSLFRSALGVSTQSA